MADPGEIALRMLDPQWSTLHGTVRQWLHHGRVQRWLASSADERSQQSTVLVTMSGSGGSTSRQMPEQTESIVRFWLERDGRSRYEFLADDGRVRNMALDDGRRVLVVPDQGEILHLESGQPQGEGVWLGDPRSLVGKVWLKFGSEEVVAGRPAMRVETVAVPGESEMFPRHMPVLRGILVGAGGYALVDAGSGLVLRYEARDDEGRPMSRHEFVTIEIDEPIADEVFTYDIPPERRDRTPAERQLDLLEERGVDISGIDRDDPSAVRRAVEEHFRRFNEETDRREARLRMPSRRRPLAETVVPLGPPPADPESARAQIAEALQALTPDGQPKAGRVERGEVLDADGPERAHLMVRGRTVTIELLDVVFLRDDEALVEFQINVSGSVNVAFKGRVVRRDGRWLVSYDTAAHLRQLGGDPVPSLLDDLGDEPDDEGRR